MPDWDVVVVGAGAAGLLAATRAAERGKRTLLLEKNRKMGVKILISGGTRGNLTHATDRRGIVAAFGSQGKFLHSALAALGPQELVDLVEAEGVATKVEDTGKIFPVSNKSIDILGAFQRRLQRSGCVSAMEEPLVELERDGDQFRLVTEKRTLTASRVVVTTGGVSFPGCGTTGEGYHWATRLGHTLVKPRPALVPLRIATEWVTQLSGITLPHVGLRVYDCFASSRHANGAQPEKMLDERHGSFLFTHFGVSGPSVLDISRAVSGYSDFSSLELEFDFHPGTALPALEESIKQATLNAGKKTLVTLFPEELPRRLVDALLETIKLPATLRVAELSKVDRGRLAQSIKRMRVPITGTLGFKKAEVTAGGISLDEIDSRSMQSRIVPNLFFAGEVLDLDGPIGGYNFQAAFSTGWLAGGTV